MLLPHNKVSGGVQDSQIMIPSFFDRFYVMPPLTNGVHYNALDHFIFKYIFFDFEDENEIKKLALNFINELRSAKEEIFRASADKTYRATVKQLPEDYDPKSWTYSFLAHDLDLIASIDDAIECGYEEGCKAALEE